MQIGTNLNLKQNQIINVLMQTLATAPTSPTPKDGQFYYNTTDGLPYIYRASTTTWQPMSPGTVTNVVGGNGLTATTAGSVITLDLSVDGSTLEIVGDTARIKDAGVTTAKIADANVTTAKIADANVTSVKITDQAITFSKINNIPQFSVIGRVAAGAGVPSAIMILDEDDMASNSATALCTQQSIRAYVDSTVSSLGTLVGSFNATTSTNFPGGSTVTKGSYWYVSVAGTVQGVVLNVGDVLICNKNSPSLTLAADWIFLETNRDQASTTVLGLLMLASSAEVNAGVDANKAVTSATLSQRTSTETRTGLIQIATQTIVNTGNDDSTAITPLKLKTFLTNYVGGFAANIGNGSNLSYVISHNLNSVDLTWNIIEVATGESVFTDVVMSTVNTATVTFGFAPTTNQYRITFKK